MKEFEIPNETNFLKMKFLAQHYGVKCFQNTMNEKYGFETYFTPILNDNGLSNEFCKLKDVKNITDSEIIELWNLVFDNYRPDKSKVDSFRFDLSRGKLFNQVVSIEKSILFIDNLRSKGYATPFMGMSVEKLIELKWIILE